MAPPLKVFLCDLTHDTIILVSDTIPINIGFIASYTKKCHGNAVDIQLFKYPSTVLAAIKASPPDVIGLSNYSWNSNLSERIAAAAKAANPDVVVVQGGTNFPHHPDQQLAFMKQRPATDLHVEFEGEAAFSGLIGRVLESRANGTPLYNQAIDGMVFIDRSSGALVKGERPDRLKQLDDIPSPYLTGILDQFFDGRLTPFLETNRGCPFKCSFCHTGADYFQKIHNFSIERTQAEIAYIAARASKLGIVNLHIADTNFGMFQRDREICLSLDEAQRNHGWPLQVMATTGKNNKERVIEITGILGKMFSVNMSVQSMDPTVLDNIHRSNIKLEHYVEVNRHLMESGRATKAELIIGLPGETRESFLKGARDVIESGVSSVTIYTLMLLNGTEFKDPEYRERFGINGRFRIVPLNFGEYDGERVFDYEEVCTQTKSMSFDDYLYLRGYALTIESIHNGRPFEELFRYALGQGQSRSTMLSMVYDAVESAPEAIQLVYRDFMEETRSELWESENDLVSHYKIERNYQLLSQGQVGGNLIYKYKSKNLAFLAPQWIDFLSDCLKKIIETTCHDEQIVSALTEVEQLTRFCRARIAGLLDASADLSPIEMEFDYDIPTWLRAEEGRPLNEFRLNRPRCFRFVYTPDQLRARQDQFRRYGTDVNALSKIVTRISNLENLFRRVESDSGTEELFRDDDGERFTRYTLAN